MNVDALLGKHLHEVAVQVVALLAPSQVSLNSIKCDPYRLSTDATEAECAALCTAPYKWCRSKASGCFSGECKGVKEYGSGTKCEWEEDEESVVWTVCPAPPFASATTVTTTNTATAKSRRCNCKAACLMVVQREGL